MWKRAYHGSILETFTSCLEKQANNVLTCFGKYWHFCPPHPFFFAHFTKGIHLLVRKDCEKKTKQGGHFFSVLRRLGTESTQSEMCVRAKSSHSLCFAALLKIKSCSVNTCTGTHTSMQTHMHMLMRTPALNAPVVLYGSCSSPLNRRWSTENFHLCVGGWVRLLLTMCVCALK